jgi:hypothetical protein
MIDVQLQVFVFFLVAILFPGVPRNNIPYLVLARRQSTAAWLLLVLSYYGYNNFSINFTYPFLHLPLCGAITLVLLSRPYKAH